MSVRSVVRNIFKREGLDDTFLESYRKILFGQYKSLHGAVDNPEARQEAESVMKMDPEQLDWDDLYRLELAIIKLEPDDLLRRRAWILRNEYKEMASPEEYKDYLASEPPPASANANAELLRADLVRLQEELNWRYIVIWILEAYRSSILRILVRRTFLVVLISFALVYWSWSVAFVASWTGLNLPFLAGIIVPGIVGGLISTVRRVQGARLGNNADLDLSQLEQGNTSIYLSPFLGGVFALVLFFLFAGRFLAGDLFPKVEMESLMVSGLEELNLNETAKLMLWSFLAGFAEKLVPDRLERLAQRTEETSTVRQKAQRTPAPS